MKKQIALALVGAMLACTAIGCGSTGSSAGSTSAGTSGQTTAVAEGSETTAEQNGPKVVNVGISGTLESLNPLTANQTGGWSSIPCYYETMVSLDTHAGSYEMCLAKSVEKTGDLDYTVTLYDYITDWKGNAITADDIIYIYEQARASGSYTNLTTYLNNIEKVDDYTMIFHMNSDQILMIETILSSIPVVDQAEYEADENQMALSCVGTGRYKVEEFVPSASIKLVKNENYWQTDESLICSRSGDGTADEINILSITEDAQMSVALETGTIDIAKIPSASAERFMNNEDYQVYTATSTAGYYLKFNGSPTSVFYQNQALRQAVCYAINVDDIVAGAYNGDAEKAYEAAVPTVDGFQEQWMSEAYYDYDPEKAAELLTEAGYAPGELTVRLVILQNDINNAWATIIQAELAAIGINVEINSYDSALWFNSWISGDYDILGTNTANQNVALSISASVGDKNYAAVPGYEEQTQDTYVQDLFTKICDPNTSTAELINEAHEYCVDQAYVYNLAFPHQYTFAKTSLGLEEPAYAHNFILIPSGFTYK